MAINYTRINWQAYPNTTTKISAANLNIMDKGIADLDSAIDGINTKIGSTSISGVGDGTVTGAISSLNTASYKTGDSTSTTINSTDYIPMSTSSAKKKVTYSTLASKLIGNTSISTIGDGTVTGAISSLNSDLNRGFVQVSGNGVKTFYQLGAELYALIDKTKITEHSMFNFRDISRAMVSQVTDNSINAGCILSGHVEGFSLEASSATWYQLDIVSGQFTDRTSNVIGASDHLTFYY